MSTHNIYFRHEIRKILCGYPLLSVAMQADQSLLWEHGQSYRKCCALAHL